MRLFTHLLYICFGFGVLLPINLLQAQSTFHNIGNLQIHTNGAIGFHLNVINDGDFSVNEGLAGFYHPTETLTISGTNASIFRDMEVDVAQGLHLKTAIGVTNSLLFIQGNIVSPRDDDFIYSHFFNNSIYIGDNNENYIDGYAKFTGKEGFVFPIGDAGYLRPLGIVAQEDITSYSAAYYKEDPSTPSVLPMSMNPISKEKKIKTVSEQEYWSFRGSKTTMAILHWDTNSNIASLTQNMERLTVVGWHKERLRWEDLGNSHLEGSIQKGTITSSVFLPDDYDAITFGASQNQGETPEDSTQVNFVTTPNADGDNDYLDLSSILISDNNELSIYNRWGRQVYVEKDYKNGFVGQANVSSVIQLDKGLPDGTYYYVLTFFDTGQQFTGWIYLSR